MGFLKRTSPGQTRSKADREHDLDREIQSHLDLEVEESGPRAARRVFGNTTLVKEDVRAEWGWPRLDQFVRDVRFGFRQIRRNLRFSTMAIATLAIGIGGMAAMFSAFDTILIRPLPYTAADQLVMIWDDLSRDGIPKHFPSSAEMLEWRRQNTVFSDIASMQSQDATLSGGGAPDQVRARKATANIWSVLGVSPRIGRVFTAEEDDKGVRVLLISHGLWQRRFGGSPDVLGRTLTVNDNPYEVIGVMPQEFFFLPGPDIDIWMPASFPP
jgi:hypothetical protein